MAMQTNLRSLLFGFTFLFLIASGARVRPHLAITSVAEDTQTTQGERYVCLQKWTKGTLSSGYDDKFCLVKKPSEWKGKHIKVAPFKECEDKASMEVCHLKDEGTDTERVGYKSMKHVAFSCFQKIDDENMQELERKNDCDESEGGTIAPAPAPAVELAVTTPTTPTMTWEQIYSGAEEQIVDAVGLFDEAGTWEVPRTGKRIKCCVSSEGKPTQLHDLSEDLVSTRWYALDKQGCGTLSGDTYHNGLEPYGKRKEKTCSVRVDELMRASGYDLKEVMNLKLPWLSALVVIDVQHCFTDGKTREGTLVTSKRNEGDKGLQSEKGDSTWKESVVQYVTQWMERGQPIVLLQDFHPDNHVSFITGEGDEEKWDPTDNLRKRIMTSEDFLYSNSGFDNDKSLAWEEKEYMAPVFPSHCVQGTEETKLVDGLCEAVGGSYDENLACKVDAIAHPNVKVVQKGTNKNIDSFGGIYDNRFGYIPEFQDDATEELAKHASWGVLEWLDSMKISSVENIGIADDYCVKTTALDLASEERAKKAGAIAIPHVFINPKYTYGIVAHLWEEPDVGHGIPPLYEQMVVDLTRGGVKVKEEPKKKEEPKEASQDV